nr:patatin-like phospholipase family protein [Burkholderia ubonensis]
MRLDVDRKVIAANRLTNRKFQFSKEATPDVPITLAARASASIPIVFAPVAVAGGLMVDGGTCNNIPVSDLTVDNVPRVGTISIASANLFAYNLGRGVEQSGSSSGS